MKSIISVIMTATLLLSALTACASNRTGRVEEARTTPSTGVTATERPASTMRPETEERDRNAGMEDGLGDAGQAAGDAVGDVVGGVGNAMGDAVEGVGDAVDDMVDDMKDGDGRVTDNDGVLGNERAHKNG